MVACFIDIIENHRPVPLPVTLKLLQKIAFVSKPEKDCLITNKICWPKKHWGFMAIASINLCIVTAFCFLACKFRAFIGYYDVISANKF